MANRYVVVPTVTVLAVMKGRLTGAVKGHALLKKKADALTMRFRQILKKIVQTKQDMGKNMRQSAFALTEAKYAAGDFRHTVFDSVETATVKVHAQQDNVAGQACDVLQSSQLDRPSVSTCCHTYVAQCQSCSSSMPLMLVNAMCRCQNPKV